MIYKPFFFFGGFAEFLFCGRQLLPEPRKCFFLSFRPVAPPSPAFGEFTRRHLRGGMRFSVPDRQRRNKIPYLFPKTECCPAMPKRKTSFLSCHCACLFVSLHKIGCGSAMPSLKTWFSSCHCTRLSLSFHKIGCGSAMPKRKTSFSSCHCARLSLSLDK